MKKFRRIYIEITNICNLKCYFCPKTSRAKKNMSVEKFTVIASKIRGYTDYVYLHVKGEPLLHPDLDRILEICNNYGFKINIVTNGTLLKEKLNILTNYYIRQINVSLHSFEKNISKNSEDSINAFNTYIDSVVQSCKKISESKGTIIRYKLWNNTDKTDNSVKMYNQLILSKLKVLYGIEELNRNINNEEYNDIVIGKNTYLSLDDEFEWPDMNSEEIKFGKVKCHGLRMHIAILVDGSVVPCCLDNNGDIILGNMFTQNLDEILSCDRAKKIQQGFKNGVCVEKLCKRCGYIKKFEE